MQVIAEITSVRNSYH